MDFTGRSDLHLGICYNLTAVLIKKTYVLLFLSLVLLVYVERMTMQFMVTDIPTVGAANLMDYSEVFDPRNGIISLFSKIKILTTEIIEISCIAPHWDSFNTTTFPLKLLVKCENIFFLFII